MTKKTSVLATLVFPKALSIKTYLHSYTPPPNGKFGTAGDKFSKGEDKKTAKPRKKTYKIN